MKKILRKNQIMITALAIMIAVAGYLNFAGTKIGEEDFLTLDGSDSELSYELSDISDEDMYAISLQEDPEGVVTEYSDILSLDTDETGAADNYLSEDMTTASDGSLTANAGTETAQDENVDTDTPGEAVFTSATGITSLAGAKLLKEQTRAKNKETLLEIINNESLTEAAKQDAVNSMIEMTEIAQKETEAEMLLEAKGYSEVVVSIGDNTADVMLGTASLNDTQTAQIMDIVQRKTEILPENIVITVSGTN